MLTIVRTAALNFEGYPAAAKSSLLLTVFVGGALRSSSRCLWLCFCVVPRNRCQYGNNLSDAAIEQLLIKLQDDNSDYDSDEFMFHKLITRPRQQYTGATLHSSQAPATAAVQPSQHGEYQVVVRFYQGFQNLLIFKIIAS